jgi:hypothetical protein
MKNSVRLQRFIDNAGKPEVALLMWCIAEVAEWQSNSLVNSCAIKV